MKKKDDSYLFDLKTVAVQPITQPMGIAYALRYIYEEKDEVERYNELV